MNLFMALFWLVVALTAFAMSWGGSESRYLHVGEGGPHIGWFALIFCAYNLVRWLSLRMQAQRKRAVAEHWQRRPRPRREPEEPDPTFDIGDRPRPPGEGIRPPP